MYNTTEITENMLRNLQNNNPTEFERLKRYLDRGLTITPHQFFANFSSRASGKSFMKWNKALDDFIMNDKRESILFQTAEHSGDVSLIIQIVTDYYPELSITEKRHKSVIVSKIQYIK